mgnify:CR=1 FL=1
MTPERAAAAAVPDGNLRNRRIAFVVMAAFFMFAPAVIYPVFLMKVMCFALFFGVGLTLTRTDAARRLEEGVEGLYDVTMRLIGLVISLAPFGVRVWERP